MTGRSCYDSMLLQCLFLLTAAFITVYVNSPRYEKDELSRHMNILAITTATLAATRAIAETASPRPMSARLRVAAFFFSAWVALGTQSAIDERVGFAKPVAPASPAAAPLRARLPPAGDEAGVMAECGLWLNRHGLAEGEQAEAAWLCEWNADKRLRVLAEVEPPKVPEDAEGRARLAEWLRSVAVTIAARLVRDPEIKYWFINYAVDRSATGVDDAFWPLAKAVVAAMGNARAVALAAKRALPPVIESSGALARAEEACGPVPARARRDKLGDQPSTPHIAAEKDADVGRNVL
jgi:hypothetical protein